MNVPIYSSRLTCYNNDSLRSSEHRASKFKPAESRVGYRNKYFRRTARKDRQRAGEWRTYSEISSADRAKVKDALNRIESQLELSGGVEGLSAEQKANVFNDQELINTLLTKASDDSRLVCRREKKVGSHRPITECMTVAERHRAYENAQKAMRDVRVPTLKAR